MRWILVIHGDIDHDAEMMYDTTMKSKRQVITVDSLRGLLPRSVLRISTGDIITPAARDVLEELHIRVDVGDMRTTPSNFHAPYINRDEIRRLVRQKLGDQFDENIIASECEKVIQALTDMKQQHEHTNGLHEQKRPCLDRCGWEKNIRPDDQRVVISALGLFRGNLPALVAALLERHGCCVLSLKQYNVANRLLMVIIVAIGGLSMTISKLDQICHEASRSLGLSFSVVPVRENREDNNIIPTP